MYLNLWQKVFLPSPYRILIIYKIVLEMIDCIHAQIPKYDLFLFVASLSLALEQSLSSLFLSHIISEYLRLFHFKFLK